MFTKIVLISIGTICVVLFVGLVVIISPSFLDARTNAIAERNTILQLPHETITPPQPLYKSKNGICINWIEQNQTHIQSAEGWINFTTHQIEPSCYRSEI